MSDKKNWKITFVKIAIILSILLLCGAASYFGVIYLRQEEVLSVKMLENSDLKEEVIGFSFEKLPDLYTGLVALDTEITLVKNEIERLVIIEKEFPEQSKITRAQKKQWQTLRKRLDIALAKLGKEVQTLYVAYLVNTNDGLERIDSVKDDLKKEFANIIDSSAESTQCLRKPDPDKEKGVVDKITEPFKKIKQRFL